MLTLSRKPLPASAVFSVPGIYCCYRSLTNRSSDYNQYYEELGVENGSDQGAVRDAFIKLAKKHHPDSGYASADAVKFQQIDNAYRRLMEKFSNERHNHNKCEGEFGLYYEQKRKQREMEEKIAEFQEEDEETKRFEIKRTTSQHRQFLSYEGIGYGTPSDREKQYSQYKVLRATENVTDYRVQKLSEEYPETALVAKDRREAKKIRTRFGIDRIVDDMIQEAIARGDFDNLSMAGKPLKNQNFNPYVDTVTHKMNEVLINNGYAPEWVRLEKEVREVRTDIRKALLKAREQLGDLPLSPEDEEKWKISLEQQHKSITELNKKIDLYNLLVPILNKQSVHFPLERESQKALKEGLTKDQVPSQEETTCDDDNKKLSGFNRIFAMFRFRFS